MWNNQQTSKRNNQECINFKNTVGLTFLASFLVLQIPDFKKHL